MSGTWKLKKRLNFKVPDVPTSKLDKFGNLITNKSALLQLYKNTYIERLSEKPPLKELQKCQDLKDNLFKLRHKLTSSYPAEYWDQKQILKTC